MQILTRLAHLFLSHLLLHRVCWSQTILDSRAEYWYRKLAGFSGVWQAAKGEFAVGLKKVRTFSKSTCECGDIGFLCIPPGISFFLPFFFFSFV